MRVAIHIRHAFAARQCNQVTRPAFRIGIQALAASTDPLPHLPSIERWRAGSRDSAYDPNQYASRQEMRSFVCAQCHVEYYFEGCGNRLTYPWSNGLRADAIEQYYAQASPHDDWTHAESGAGLLKAQHPEFETWSQGIHAQSGVACADCHMPYVREGAVKVSDHQVRSPLLNVSRACQNCHRFPEQELLRRAGAIQDRTQALMIRAEEATLDLISAISERVRGESRDTSVLSSARRSHRRAQWRLDFVAAENSLGFHAPHESARLPAEAIDLARQGEIDLLRGSAAPDTDWNGAEVPER